LPVVQVGVLVLLRLNLASELLVNVESVLLELYLPLEHQCSVSLVYLLDDRLFILTTVRLFLEQRAAILKLETE